MVLPTDLSPEEQKYAAARLRELADRLVQEGMLRSPRWREAFISTRRHPYLPSYYPELGAACLLPFDPHRHELLEAVYSDQTLITKVVLAPLSRELRPGAYPMFTSSSTLPSLVVRMLEDPDVTDELPGAGDWHRHRLQCRPAVPAAGQRARDQRGHRPRTGRPRPGPARRQWLHAHPGRHRRRRGFPAARPVRPDDRHVRCTNDPAGLVGTGCT